MFHYRSLSLLTAPKVAFLRRLHVSRPLEEENSQKVALVLGSSGALGSEIARQLQRKSVHVIGADIQDTVETIQLNAFIPMPHPSQKPSLGEITQRLSEGISSNLDDQNKGLDLIVVASGGWEGDPALQPEHSTEGAFAYGDSFERMLQMNLYPVAASGYIARYYMNKGSLFVMLGAASALVPAPGMIGYGVSKSSAHYFAQSYGSLTGLSVSSKSSRKETKALRQHFEALDDMTVVGILPSILDTVTNQKAQPKADFETWTKPAYVAKEIGMWLEHPHLRPHSGSLVRVYPSNLGASFQLVR